MNQTGVVRRGKRLGDLFAKLDYPAGRLRGSAKRAQSVSLHQLHDDNRIAFMPDHFMNRDDIGVVQSGSGAGLAGEKIFPAERRFRRQELESDKAAQLRVARRPYLAHTAASDGGNDLVPPESRRRSRRRASGRRGSGENVGRRPMQETAARFIVAEHLLNHNAERMGCRGRANRATPTDRRPSLRERRETGRRLYPTSSGSIGAFATFAESLRADLPLEPGARRHPIPLHRNL
jgi:hypothetical protein